MTLSNLKYFVVLVVVQVLGLVQNMSHYICPNCQHKAHIFGKDGAKDVSREMDVDVLGKRKLHTYMKCNTHKSAAK